MKIWKYAVLFYVSVSLICVPVTAYAVAPTAAFDENEPGLQVQAIPDAQGTHVGAKAAIVIEAVSGEVLFEQDSDTRLPIASTTKIMTALITLEQENLDTPFVVNSSAIKVEGSSMGLREGDTVTLRALAIGMLLSSGNDAAGAAAVKIGGSVAGFVKLMNKRAAELGMVNTSFETPSGLDGDEHYSTAYDMAILAREALKNEEFAGICSQYRLRTSYGNPPFDRWLTNHNKLLNYYDGAIGVKTGFTKKSGRCLVSAASRDGVTLICVTLNCPNDWNVHKNLFDKYFDTVEIQNITDKIPEVKIPVTGGTLESVELLLSEEAQFPVSGKNPSVEYVINAPRFVYAPIEEGDLIGEVQIRVNKKSIKIIPLYARNDVPLLHLYEEKKSLMDKIADFFDKEN